MVELVELSNRRGGIGGVSCRSVESSYGGVVGSLKGGVVESSIDGVAGVFESVE